MNQKPSRLKSLTFQQRCWSAFRAVIDIYQEARATTGSCPVVNYERSEAGSGYVVGKVTMSLHDFISDVDIAARKALDTYELKLFNSIYVKVEDSPNKPSNLAIIQEKLGKAFIQAGIFPVKSYMRSVRK